MLSPVRYQFGRKGVLASPTVETAAYHPVGGVAMEPTGPPQSFEVEGRVGALCGGYLGDVERDLRQRQCVLDDARMARRWIYRAGARFPAKTEYSPE